MNAENMTPHGNEIVVEAWNTVQFGKFERFKHLLVAGLSGHSNELLSRTSTDPLSACSTWAAVSATPPSGLHSRSAPTAKP
jgi:hypothetical protein